MVTLYLLCGLPGSGKTTLARQLEASVPALRLCPDLWISSLLTDVADVKERNRLRTPVETLQWQTAADCLRLGVNVLLENGFWSRAERADFLSRGRGVGARVELHYRNVPLETLWQRLAARNAALPPGCLPVTREELEAWHAVFEPPNTDEATTFDSYREYTF